MIFGVLGPLEVRHEGGLVHVRGSRPKSLLATLLLDANRVVSSDRLIDELWGLDPPETALRALRVCVSRLRKLLEPAGLDELIATQPPGYVARIGRDQLDLAMFEDLLERGRETLKKEDFTTASEELTRALSLWRGPPLADIEGEFVRPAASRLEELRLHALDLRIEADLALGAHEPLVGELQALVGEHPLNERLRAHLMRALYASGRQSDALDVYRKGRDRLVEELGIEPSPALRAVEQEILRQDPSLEVAAREEADSTAAQEPWPERSILLLPSTPNALGLLLSLAEPLALRPPHEVILMQLVASTDELGPTVTGLHDTRDELRERGVAARAAAFSSAHAGVDAVQLATEQAVDLLLADLSISERGSPLPADALALLSGAPCDVALLACDDEQIELGEHSTVIVPFGASGPDWAAAELAAWIVRAHDARLLLAGVGTRAHEGHGVSRLLARASLVLQKVLGIAAEPLLVIGGEDTLVDAVQDAGLIVAGLPNRERGSELGSARRVLIEEARPPVLLVGEGLRPGGLAPEHTMTRFTWSMTAA